MQALSHNRALVVAATLLWLLLIAFIHPISHDESQYVAATWLVGHGLLPYRDFAYLQTPLQPFVFAPLHWIFRHDLLVWSRLANAGLAAGTLALVYSAVRRAGGKTGAALASALLLLTCHAFIWAAGVARNDMLPAALLAAGLRIEVSHPRSWGHALAGMALGLSAAAKISYAIPPIAIITILFVSRERQWRRSALWLSLGALVGFAPAVVLALNASDAFLFEVFTFGLRAPVIWYRELGETWAIGSLRFAYLIAVAAIGPALIASIAVVVRVAQEPERWFGDRARRVLIAAAAGGLLSAALNRPFNAPYLVPMLPPLFVLVGLELSQERVPSQLLRFAGGASAAIALVWPASCIGETVIHGAFPLIDAEARSKEIGDELRARGMHGTIAGLSEQYLVDSGHALDSRFAAGPFLFRSVGLVSADQAAKWHIVTRDQYASIAASSPGAIVTGGERNKVVKPDVELAAIASKLGYLPVAHVRKYTIWMRPEPGSP